MIYDPFTLKVPSQGTLPVTDPFAQASAPVPMTANSEAPYPVLDNNDPSPLDPMGGGGKTANDFLTMLGGLKAPAAPPIMPAPTVAAPHQARAIPGGLQQLIAMLGGSGGQVPNLRL